MLCCKPASLLGRYQRGNEGRQVLLYLSAKYCRGRQTLVEISEHLNISIGGLTAGRTVFKKRLTENNKLRQRVSRLEASLAQQNEVQ